MTGALRPGDPRQLGGYELLRRLGEGGTYVDGPSPAEVVQEQGPLTAGNPESLFRLTTRDGTVVELAEMYLP